MAANYEDDSLSVATANGTYISQILRSHYDGTEHVQHSGAVGTTHGYVTVYADASQLPCTGLSFIWQGRQYRRSWKCYHRPRTIVTLAKRFAADVAQRP